MPYEKLKVLIIDDEEIVCDLLKNELSENGYLCTIALNASAAFKILETDKFEIVLLDIRLPGISGMDILREIRLNHHNSAAIMITAVNQIDVVIEAMKLGASDYIVKPFTLDRVNASIRQVLETKKYLSGKINSNAQYFADGTKEDRQAMGIYFKQMDAIASGVDASYDMFIGYSNIVTERTIEIAKQLDIPEKEIQRWAIARSTLYYNKRRALNSSLDKLRRNPLAQWIMGIMPSCLDIPNLDEDQN